MKETCPSTSPVFAVRTRVIAPMVLTAALYVASARRVRAEERLDFKTLFYQEDDDRVRVIAPSVQMEKELGANTTIKIDGVYNAISGATPTGAPPYETVTDIITVALPGVPSAAPGGGDDGDDYEDEDEDEDEGEEDRGERRVGGRARTGKYAGVSAATPSPGGGGASSGGGGGGGGTKTREVTRTVPSDKVPKVETDDTRLGINIELLKRIGRHTPSIMFSHSSESDYVSSGLALRDSIDFNQKNTTLMLGGAFNMDDVDGQWLASTESKDTYDLILGLTQILDAQTFITCNYAFGNASGYLGDPYKVVELNGELVPEKRPDSRDKQIVYLSLTRYVRTLRGSAELGYRWYDDTVGVAADTYSLAWYQKLGDDFIVRPAVRFYSQTAADFYGVQFAGAPEYYSSDYRTSAFDSFGYGLKVIWTASDRLSFDAAYERYEQEGTDGVTVDDAYPSANYIIVGCRLWL